MNITEARQCLALIAGYWPTPAITEEETVAWLTELGPLEGWRVRAALGVEKGREWRPRPGELGEIVHAWSRRQAENSKPALPAASRFTPRSEWHERMAAVRRALDEARQRNPRLR